MLILESSTVVQYSFPTFQLQNETSIILLHLREYENYNRTFTFLYFLRFYRIKYQISFEKDAKMTIKN